MKIQVELHAVLRDLLPDGKGDVELRDSATINDILDHLGIDEEMRELITVNGEQAQDYGVTLSDGDSVEIFPPVMGGARSPYLDEGIRLFEEGDFFLAHETLEEHWIEAPAEERDFYQGLIHLAVGFHHLGRGNQKGGRLQFTKALRRLETYPDSHEGIDLATLRDFLSGALDRIERGEEVSPPSLAS